MTIKVTVPEVIRQFVEGKYGGFTSGAVRLPDGSDLYHVLYDLLERRPCDQPVDRGNLELQLPNRAYGKRMQTFNYLSQRSQHILSRHFEVKMWAEFHDYVDEQKHLHGVNYADAVHTFMCRYGIDSLSEDAFVKNYYRWREKVRGRSEKRRYRKKASR